MKKLRIYHVVGARPNFVKIAPIMDALLRYRGDIVQTLIHTGQHYDNVMSDGFFKDLGIPKPDINLGVRPGSHAGQTADIMKKLDGIVKKGRPDILLVVGDVTSTLAASIVASKKGVPVAHVEAGLRSFDRTMPEEINRVVTDSLSRYHFVTSAEAVRNLKKEGVPSKGIHFVGNVMIDSLFRYKQICEKNPILEVLDLYGKKSVEPYSIVTIHRPSNVDEKGALAGIIDALEEIQKHIKIIFPIHPRTRIKIGEFKFQRKLKKMKNLKVIDPLSYIEFLRLYSKSRFVMTDSGGVQEETTMLNIPCLTLRNNTERPVTVSHGTNKVIGSRRDDIVDEALRLLDRKPAARKRPPLWDGRASARIAKILVREIKRDR